MSARAAVGSIACVAVLLLAACPEAKPARGVEAKAAPPAAGQAAASAATATAGASPAAKPHERPALRVTLWRFDRLDDGQLPVGMRGRSGKWGAATPHGAKASAKTGKVIVQSAKSGPSAFNVLLVGTVDERDLALAVRLRALAGKHSRGGGVLWRAKDAQSYYAARYDPLADNVALYVVKDGVRKQLARASLKRDHGAWHALRVTMRGDHIQCFLDGKRVLDHHDTTLAASGKVGLWTEADAVSELDDLSVRNLQPR